MKDILTAIKTILQNSSELSYIANNSIYIAPDEDFFESAKTFPQINISDGGTVYTIEENGGVWEKQCTVKLSVMQLLEVEDISIMGQAAPKIYGILETVNSIHTVLCDNKLSLAEVELALPFSDEKTIYIENDIPIVKKAVNYTYRKFGKF